MPRADTLWKRLESARPPELRKLGEIMELSDFGCKADAVLVEELSKEIRSAAGHSWVNVFRHAHQFPYKQILIDVADRMAPGWTPLSWTHYKLGDSHSETELEDKIWSFFEDRMAEKMKGQPPEETDRVRKEVEEELRKMGYSEAVADLASSIPGVLWVVRGRGVVLLTLIFAPVALWWLGLTAYRKTIPAVLHLIQIRKLREIEDTLG